MTSRSATCGTPAATDAGKAAVKAARISKVVCKGTAGATGSLTLSGGTITVERAFEEPKPYLRSRKQFESLLKVALEARVRRSLHRRGLARRWRGQPNPVTSTKTYCLVNGGKVAFDENVARPVHPPQAGRAGQVLEGRRGGHRADHPAGQEDRLRHRVPQGKGSRRVGYRDDKLHGEEKTHGERQAEVASPGTTPASASGSKELHPSGKLKRYSRKFADGYARACREGRRQGLRGCVLAGGAGRQGAAQAVRLRGRRPRPSLRRHRQGGPRGRPGRTASSRRRAPGTSDYGSRSEVAFKDGKKHGEERVLGKDGKLGGDHHLGSRDVKHGKELTYADDGKKVVKEIVWKAGEMKQLTERYLNGNPKLQEIYDSPEEEAA